MYFILTCVFIPHCDADGGVEWGECDDLKGSVRTKSNGFSCPAICKDVCTFDATVVEADNPAASRVYKITSNLSSSKSPPKRKIRKLRKQYGSRRDPDSLSSSELHLGSNSHSHYSWRMPHLHRSNVTYITHLIRYMPLLWTSTCGNKSNCKR